jgi:TRAP-type C4-dicarboxylate transport system substrate-binding protein
VYSRAELSRMVVLVVALSLTAAATGAFAREFRAADTQSEDYPTVQALRHMGRVIAERSNGRHQIKVFHSHQLGEEKEPLEQTRAGAIDLNRTNAALIGNMVPSMNVLAMPFLFLQQSEQMSEMIRSLGADPVELPYGQVLTGLATKLIDGVENNWPSFVTTIVADFDRKPFEQAMTGIYARTQRDPAAAPLIERIRKVE